MRRLIRPAVAALTLALTSTAYAGTRVTGTPGPDVLVGTAGVDRVRGLAGRDVIRTGAGDDEVRPGQGADVVRTGRGDDVVLVTQDGDRDRIDCGPGEDTVYAAADRDGVDQFVSCEHLLVAHRERRDQSSGSSRVSSTSRSATSQPKS